MLIRAWKQYGRLAAFQSITRGLSSLNEETLKSPLHELHLQHKGKMARYAGYSIPIEYQDMGMIKEHQHTRLNCSLFDTSFMGLIKIYGAHRHDFLERVVVTDTYDLQEGQSKWSLIMNKKGGIVDETLITNMGEYFALMINGICREKDLRYLNRVMEREFSKSSKNDNLRIQSIRNHCFMSLHGPQAEPLYQALLGSSLNLKKMPFLTSREHSIRRIDAPCLTFHFGTTGEDGFEIFLPEDKAANFASLVLSEKLGLREPVARLGGLGARDTLRLEAGVCMYGRELTESLTPVEAQLSFAIDRRRRELGGFYGYEIIKRQLGMGVMMRRCGFIAEGPTVRDQTEISDDYGEQVGYVTSGVFSPTLKQPIGMAYVKVPFHKIGTRLFAGPASECQPITVHPLPFIESKFHPYF